MTEDLIKEKIANAFRQHFFHYGYKKTSVDEVAAELKISKKTIYSFFSSKQDIHTYIVKALATEKVDDIRQMLGEFETNSEKLEHLVVLAFQNRREKMKMYGHKFTDIHESEMMFQIFSDAFYHLFKEIIEAGILTGEFKVNDLEITLGYIQVIMRNSIELMDENIDFPIELHAKDAVLKLVTPCK